MILVVERRYEVARRFHVYMLLVSVVTLTLCFAVRSPVAEENCSLVGRVAYLNGTPGANADVYLMGTGPDGTKYDRNCTSGADGLFIFEEFPCGAVWTYIVSAWGGENGPTYAAKHLSGDIIGRDTLVLLWVPFITVSGYLRDEMTNEPVVNATVTVVPGDGTRTTRTGRSDTSGYYRIDNIEAGRYDLVVSVSHNRYTAATKTLTLTENDTDSVALDLQLTRKEVTFNIRVKDRCTNEAVPDANIVIVSALGDTIENGYGEQASFHLPYRDYTCLVSAAGYRDGSVLLTRPDIEVSMYLDGEGRGPGGVHIRVTGTGGTPIDSARVMAKRYHPDRRFTDNSGWAFLGDTNSGSACGGRGLATVTAWKPGFLIDSADIEVQSPDDTLELVLAAVSPGQHIITGTVYDEQGVVLPNACVESPDYCVLTDANGFFVLPYPYFSKSPYTSLAAYTSVVRIEYPESTVTISRRVYLDSVPLSDTVTHLDIVIDTSDTTTTLGGTGIRQSRGASENAVSCVHAVNGTFEVVCAVFSRVRLFGIDGRVLYRCSVDPGRHVIPLPTHLARSRPLLVELSGRSGKSRKVFMVIINGRRTSIQPCLKKQEDENN